MITKEEIKAELERMNIDEINSIGLDFTLWKLSEIDELNTEYDVAEYLPGYYAVGSNGGGEMLAVELETEMIYSIPFIPMESNDRLLIANKLEYLTKMNK
jgi:hypothetical protein